MDNKRITVVMGHYGSGKTFVAVNLALAIKRANKPVSIYDLDIVNPYYRTVDAKEILDSEGIELVVSPYAETNVDIPAMNSMAYKMVSDLSRYAVADIGGDDRGALALGRFRDKIKEENNYDALWIVNNLRPETRTIEDALEIKREIELTAGLNFTAIVNNANLGQETTKDVIIKGYEFTKKLSKITKLPIKFTAVREDLIDEQLKKELKDILPIQPIKYEEWL